MLIADICKEDATIPLSKEIKVLRSKALLTQEVFAMQIGVSASTVILLENGKSKTKSYCYEIH